MIAGICFVGALFSAGAQAHAAVDVRAASLEPGFRSGVTDYTLPSETCASRFELEVRAPGGGEARIGKARWFGDTDSRRLRLDAGQAVKVRTREGGDDDRYFVRCLPAEFPAYEYERVARPASPFYAVTPAGTHAAIFDRRGVSVWWRTVGDGYLSDAKVLADGTIAAYHGRFSETDPAGAYEIRRPDGRLIGDHHPLPGSRQHGGGPDRLRGGAGNDRLDGGPKRDDCSGGAHSDRGSRACETRSSL